MSDDSLDPDLIEEFERLKAQPAPDLWSEIVARKEHGVPSVPGDRAVLSEVDTVELVPDRWMVLAAAAVIFVVAGIGLAAINNRGDEGTIDLGENVTVPTTGVSQEPEPNSSDPLDGLDRLDDCGPELGESLSQGMPTFDYEPSESPADLIAQSPIIVRGQLIEATELAGGSGLSVKTFELVGSAAGAEPRVFNLWTPATIAPNGFLGGDFVAFLTGEVVEHPTFGDSLWVTHLEGLWVGCDQQGPAASVIALPIEDGWDPIKQDGVSLKELWQAVLFPAGSSSVPLGEPTHTVDGVDVFDLQLTQGERFRLSLPEGMGAGASVVEHPGKPGATITSPTVQIDLGYGFCRTPFGLQLNSLGSEIRIEGSSIRICRPDELLAMSIELDSDSDELLDPARFDLRPIVPGGSYGELLNDFKPELASCGNCDPNGPTLYPTLNIVVNRTGHTSFTAVSLDSLEEVWTIDTSGFGSQMHSGADALYFSDPAGPFLKVDAATGAELWRNEFVEEHAHKISGLSSNSILMQSSFSSEGDSRPPLLRRIDDNSGVVLWTAEGREWGEWQGGRVVVIDGVAVLMDTYDNVTDPNAEAGGQVFGFDTETGERVWVTDLEVPAARFSSGLLVVAEFEDGRALLAQTVSAEIMRIDPQTGAVLWKTRTTASSIDGTDFDADGNLAISLQTTTGQVLLDPTTGAITP